MQQLLNDIDSIKEQQSISPFDKKGLEEFIIHSLKLEKQRSVLTCKSHSFRVSAVRGKTKGFSNVVLSLSALLKYDNKPFVVIVVRSGKLDFLLSNTTFLRKISHSSKELTQTNIRGSFLGQDIKDKFADLSNEESNFQKLFELHQNIDQSQNIDRLVKATSAIVGFNNRYKPTQVQKESILNAPSRYKEIWKEYEKFQGLAHELDSKAQSLKGKIIEASKIRNGNIRGNTIEQILTGGFNEHRTEDILYKIDDQVSVLIDIKTKLSHLNSSPKAFNVDKTLKILAKEKQLFCFFFLLINNEENVIHSKLIPILDTKFISMLRVQHHWAGRNSRGVTQISGDIHELVKRRNLVSIDLDHAKKFLQGLLDI